MTANPFDDLDKLRLDQQQLERIRAAKAATKHHVTKPRRGAFIGGPFPFTQFSIAARLPGKALAVWMLVHHRARVTRKTTVTLPAGLLTTAGINRNAKARALHELERVGLIQLVRAAGQTPRVSLVELPDC